MYISLFRVTIFVNYNSEFQEHFEVHYTHTYVVSFHYSDYQTNYAFLKSYFHTDSK
jgi:hypothetical protein